jgi:conjugative transfer signal peptidase TraF
MIKNLTRIKNKGTLLALFSPLFLVGILHVVTEFTFRIYTNRSDSLPKGFYKSVDKKSIEVGDIVAFEVPENVLNLIQSRQLNSYKRFFKRVAAMPGDYVCYSTDSVIIFDTYYPIKKDTLTSLGLSLANNCGPVPAGYFFAMSDDIANGFDSRYYGLVPATNIEDVIIKL